MPAPATTTMDGNEWALSLLGSSQGVEMSVRLARLIGQGLADAISRDGANAAGMAFLGLALSKAEPKEVLSLVKQLLSGCLMDGKPLFGPDGKGGVFETAFQGRILFLYKLAAWAIKENSGDFSVVFGSPLANGASLGTNSDDGSTSEKIGSSSGLS